MITIDKFLDSFIEQMNSPRGVIPVDNITGKNITDKETLKKYIQVIWSNNFTVFVNNFIHQCFFRVKGSDKLVNPGIILVNNDGWDDIKEPDLIKYFLLISWDNAQTKQ